MSNLTLIEKCEDIGIEQDVINFINNDPDMKAGVLKAYEYHAAHISSLPLKQQLRICLATVSFSTKMLTNYQKEMKSFTDSLKK